MRLRSQPFAHGDNKVFFNIWSACSYSSGNNTLPVYSSWLATCTNRSIDLDGSADMESTGYPKWASLAVPGNASFDIQQAVALALPTSHHQHWSVFQIILPVISAIAAIVLTVIAMTLRQRQLPRVSFGRTPRVRSVVHQSEDWEIEPSEPAPSILKDSGNLYEPVPFPVETAHTLPNPELAKGRPFVRDEAPRDYPFSAEAQAAFQVPPIAPVRTRSDPKFDSSSPTPNGKWSLSKSSRIHVPNLFRRGPVRVTEKVPHKGFRIDQSTDASSSKRSTFATTTEELHTVRTNDEAEELWN
ncbi:hypothetical protein CPB84DRAFT_246490 [Gymnopilus junonius]|uniref:Transmembrane protein n=1 Tax=Gymnopilus junonius TaxID=109634 RepID=A0A9P5TQS5_GYMJU|nr:hypothetical protein CPB84DRAFT_246490 [Gymnopilus junonius]